MIPSVYGWRVGKSLMSSIVPAYGTGWVLPSARNRSAMPRWSRSSMVRAWNPPAREPTSSGRRSSLDDHHVDPGQRQLAGQHHAHGTGPDDDHLDHDDPFALPSRMLAQNESGPGGGSVAGHHGARAGELAEPDLTGNRGHPRPASSVRERMPSLR